MSSSSKSVKSKNKWLDWNVYHILEDFEHHDNTITGSSHSKSWQVNETINIFYGHIFGKIVFMDSRNDVHHSPNLLKGLLLPTDYWYAFNIVILETCQMFTSTQVIFNMIGQEK